MRLQVASGGKQGKSKLATRAAALTTLAASAVTMGLIGLTGCGQTYRPVVSAINPVGPAEQPEKFAIAVSSPSPTSPGLATFVDFSGDSILSTPQILTNPSYFGIDPAGVYGYTVNPSGVFADFSLGNPVGLITSDIVQTTLAANAAPASVTAFSIGGAFNIFIPEPGISQVAVLTNPGSPSLVQSLAVGANPIYVVGINTAERVYAISQNAAGTNGQLASIEGTPVSVSATIPVGVKPVYGVMTPDTRRAFILNEGSGTVSVVNVLNNALDSTTPLITLPPVTYTNAAGATVTTAANPVWADLSPRIGGTVGNNQLVVLNQGDGIGPGTLSIINIPLCSQTAQSTNPNCTATNPVDAVGFGTFLTAVPVSVGVNPVMVSILQDGTRAYVVNAGNSTTPSSVSVVSLTSGLVTATIAGDATSTVASAVWGHQLNSIAATTGTPTGKVYVTASDSRYMTVIRTDTDAVDTHISLQGAGLRVQVNVP